MAFITTKNLSRFWEGAKTFLNDIFYTKETIDGKITELNDAIATAAGQHWSTELVDAIPDVETAKSNVIYFVPKTDALQDNVYDQYMLINGAMEALGSTELQMAAATDEEIDALFTEADDPEATT